jgi:hypothetical protein
MFDIICECITFDLGRSFSDSFEYMSETPSKAAVDGLNREAQMTSRKVISNRKIGNLNKSLKKLKR